MLKALTSLAVLATLAVPLVRSPEVPSGEHCRALCMELPPTSLTASGDDDCSRLSREAGYPCHVPYGGLQQSYDFGPPRSAIRHRDQGPAIPDSSNFGLY